MRLVVDANILVGELLRARGRKLIADERLELFLAAKVWEEAQHELRKRANIITERGRLSTEASAEMFESAMFVAGRQLTVYQEVAYSHLEGEALARIPRDPDD